MQHRVTARVAMASAAVCFLVVPAGCGGKSNPSAPASTSFSTSLSGTAVRGAVATHTVNLPRAGSGTFTVSGFASGELPHLDVRTSSGTLVGQVDCPSANAFCTSVTLTASVQAGSYDVRVSGGNIGIGGARYTLAVRVD